MINKFENKNIAIMGNRNTKRRCYEMLKDNNICTIEVHDFSISYPHNLPYLNITDENGLEYHFGMVNDIVDMSTEEAYIITKIAFRPENLGEKSLPSKHKFVFNNKESIISFINQVMIHKRMY